MSLARKILSNTASQVAGRFATAFLAVVVVKILTVYLGQSGYGQYATIYEFLAFFGAFADFGIFTIAVREMSRKGLTNKSSLETRLHFVLCLRLVRCFLLLEPRF
jgi:O-antigen/teichoic acid export membrane protein